MMNDVVLISDPELKRLLPRRSPAEYAQLEESILKDGCRDPIIIWGNLIVDGHHRYEICQKHKIPFQTQALEFAYREEVIYWICLRQMGQRNIPSELLKYQIGKRFLVEKFLTARNPKERNLYSGVSADHMTRTQKNRRLGLAGMIGQEYNVSHFAVHTYKDIASAIDEIADKDIRLSELYLSGQMRIKKDDLLSIAAMSLWQIRALTNSLLRQNKTICHSQDVLEALSSRDLQKENQAARERRRSASLASHPSVKDMPAYDPDGEAASLSLTIPSWQSSLERLFIKTDLHKISDKAKTQLKEELLNLRDSVDLVLLEIDEEVSNNG